MGAIRAPVGGTDRPRVPSGSAPDRSTPLCQVEDVLGKPRRSRGGHLAAEALAPDRLPLGGRVDQHRSQVVAEPRERGWIAAKLESAAVDRPAGGRLVLGRHFEAAEELVPVDDLRAADLVQRPEGQELAQVLRRKRQAGHAAVDGLVHRLHAGAGDEDPTGIVRLEVVAVIEVYEAHAPRYRRLQLADHVVHDVLAEADAHRLRWVGKRGDDAVDHRGRVSGEAIVLDHVGLEATEVDEHAARRGWPVDRWAADERSDDLMPRQPVVPRPLPGVDTWEPLDEVVLHGT